MPKVTIYSDVVGIPHTFLGVTDDNGNTIYRGFGPEKTGVWGKGKVFDDEGHDYHHSYEMNISQEQYSRLIDNINKSSENPNDYNLLKGSQCTVWAMDMLYDSGIIEPFAGTFEPSINTGDYFIPAGFAQTLALNPWMQATGIFFDDLLNDTINFWKNFFNPTADAELYDPITLDLNNDGKISTLNLSDGVYFDHNGDNIAFKTSWIGKEDGILVLDKNLNNQIDDGNELFGNFTKIEESKFAINGYHALSLQDTNNDGRIDTLDKNFSKLKIWQDLNEDGISQSNEIKTLKEHGIKSISLNFTKPTNSNILKDSSDNVNLNDTLNNQTNNSNINNPDNHINSSISNNNLNLNSALNNQSNNFGIPNDNKATLISHFTRDDNTTSLVADIDLKVDTINSTHLDNPKELTTKQILKANIKGQGFLKDLNVSAVLSPTLSTMLDNYSSLKTRQEQVDMLPSLIDEWVKANSKIDINNYSISKIVINQSNSVDTQILNLLDTLSNLDIDYENKREYIKSIKIASNFDTFRSFKFVA